MKFSFKNIGIIEEAEIELNELNGLTIITGLNDTGKSFLTKSIFSIIKAINESNSQRKIEQIEIVQSNLNQIFGYIRNSIAITPEILRDVAPAPISREIIRQLQSETPYEIIIPIIQEYQKKIEKQLDTTKLPIQRALSFGNVKTEIDKKFQEIYLKFSTENSEETVLKNFFDNIIIKKYFQNQINSLNISDTSSIDISVGDNKILQVVIHKNETRTFDYKGLLNFVDSTIIETPTILQLTRYIYSTLAFGSPSLTNRMVQQRSELPYHFYDLAEKLFTSSSPSPTTEAMSELYEKISAVINGRVELEPTDLNFYYISNDKRKINSFNIATGIKSFGLLQLLLAGGFISDNSLLIIDEPEVHLHLKWQLAYAEIIVALSAAGIPIIISTHSPFFLEALTGFVKKSQKDINVKVYHGSKNEVSGRQIFKDVSENLDPIFSQLSEQVAKIQMLN